MGLSGTDAAKEAAEIVITDDNFRSIKDAVLYGRTIYLNILKFCRFQLTINVAAVVTCAVMPLVFGIEAPLTVVMMLAVNLLMDTLASLLLGKEPAKEEYMKHPPKKKDEGLINKNIFIQFTTMGLYLTLLSILWFTVPSIAELFENEAQLRSAFFGMFMFTAIFNGFNVRTDGFHIFKDLKKNESFIKVWLAMLASTVAICMIGGPIGQMFGCVRFGIKGWTAVVLIAATIIPVDLLRKAVFKTYLNE